MKSWGLILGLALGLIFQVPAFLFGFYLAEKNPTLLFIIIGGLFIMCVYLFVGLMKMCK